MRIFRCELCKKPCMLTTLDNEEIKYCPAGRESAAWKQVNKTEKAAA